MTLSDLPIRQSTYGWLFRYKLYHIPFWCLYHYLWWVTAIGNPFEAATSIFFTPYSAKFLFYVAFQAIGVYFNLYFLMPRYLEKSRFTEYIVYLVLTIVCIAGFIVPGYYVIAYLAGKTVQELYGTQASGFNFFITGSFPSTLASMTLAMSIKLTKNWVQAKRREQLLEKEKLETELKFLKSQFNPHFLFNTINSIFFLIHKNPDLASSALAKFSDLLRYQLYECNEHQIPLSHELAYLESFIELEKLRQNSNVEITCELPEQLVAPVAIAPFMLMTFVENAFKHVSRHADQPNWIRICVRLAGGQLNMEVSNSVSGDTSTEVIQYGGIGLRNVQRRLDLMYAGQYELAIQRTDTDFNVKFQLQLTEWLMPARMQTQPESVMSL